MKTTAEKIAVMQAYERGEKIQGTSLYGEWVAADRPTWDWGTSKYRVKPKPLEVSATVIGNNVIAWVPGDALGDGKQRVVRFREVTE